MLLEVRGLTVDHGGLRALDGVDLVVEAGQVVGLIGPNGAGKTTLIDAVTGYTTATAGSVCVNGRDVSAQAPHRRARLGMARTFQTLELFDDLTVAQNLAVAIGTSSASGLVADVLGPGRSAVGSDPAIADTLAHLGLSGHADRLPGELSNGERHLVALGRALVAGPQLVCLDEPGAGLDPVDTAALAAQVSAMSSGVMSSGTTSSGAMSSGPTSSDGTSSGGIGVLLVDHDMDLVMAISDVIYVLDFGRCIAVGSPAEVRRDPMVRRAYLGTSGSAP